MGNMFLGFPVPRAKIAEMIETAAPPLNHISNHLPPGSDPIAIPADISLGQLLKWNGTKFIGSDEPSGGVTLPFDDFFWRTLFESLDWLKQSNSGAGTVVGNAANISCECYGTINDRGQLYKELTYSYVPLTWAKNREFRTFVDLYADTDSTQQLEICTGDIFASYGFGFKVVNGLFSAYSKGAGGTYEETIEDFGSSGYYESKKLRARLTAGTKVEFWVDDVLVKTDTTCFPTGTTRAARVFQALARNPSAGNTGVIYFSEYQVWQEA